MKIKNFAKIKDSIIEFNDLTVLVGKPSTNKSYIMKFKYCLDETFSLINKNKFIKIFPFINFKEEMLLLDIFLTGLKLEGNIKDDDKLDLKILKKKLDNLNFSNPSIEGARKIIDKVLKNIEMFSKSSENEKFEYLFKNIFYSIFREPAQINDNFTVEYNSNVIKFENNKFSFELEKFVKIENTVFIETPLILEFEKFLPKEVASTPYHIDSLLRILREENYSFFDSEEENFIINFFNKTKKIINGEIVKENNFTYKNSQGKIFNIVNTSSGVKSIGLLQYLVRNRVLKKGSTLFWEEPEVHIHPDWQCKIAKLLLFLVKNGVKIVISTHSPIIVNALNVFAIEEKMKNKVSFNLLSVNDDIVENIVLSDDNWDLIQDELLNCLEELAWEYI
jgi:hypothetical protein